MNTELAKIYGLSKEQLILLCPMPLSLASDFLTRKPCVSRNIRSIVDVKTPAILQICKQHHWVTLLFDPVGQTIYYFDSLGKKMPASLRNSLQVNFKKWTINANSGQFQYDSYQCGVWSAAVVEDYMVHIKSNTNSTYIPLKGLTVQMTSSPGNRIDTASMYSATKRNDFRKLLQESSEPETNFLFHTKPSNKPGVIAIDAQHTLWVNPSATSGQEYLEFLNKRFWKKCFEAGNDSVYWCYDIPTEVTRCS